MIMQTFLEHLQVVIMYLIHRIYMHIHIKTWFAVCKSCCSILKWSQVRVLEDATICKCKRWSIYCCSTITPRTKTQFHLRMDVTSLRRLRNFNIFPMFLEGTNWILINLRNSWFWMFGTLDNNSISYFFLKSRNILSG